MCDEAANFDALIFKQELNEVYLLLDFISGRPDHNLSKLTGRIQDPGDVTKTLPLYAVMKRISTMCYPPANPPVERAEDAAFLLIVKDELNNLVAPARGQTIAYTTMFAEGRKATDSSRVRIAKDAFPSLINSAARFRRWKSALSWIGLTITVAAALLLWNVTYGVQLAARFDEAKRNDTETAARLFAELDKNNAKTRHDLLTVCSIPQGKHVIASAAEKPSPDQSDYNSTVQKLCNEYAYRRAMFCSAIADVGAYSQSAIFVATGPLLPIYGPQPADDCAETEVSSPTPRAGAASAASVTEVPRRRVGRQEDAQSIAGVLSTMSNSILPILFGLVGTIASLVRGIQDKIRDSVLTSRDFALLLISLPLGMIAGACVGLFLNPTTVAGQLNGTLGTFTVSASGIAFLAGYGAEVFFRALDTILSRVFSIETVAKRA